MPRLRLSIPAKQDVAKLLDWSAMHFGIAGRRRYEWLLDAAFRDIATEPDRPGSREEERLGPGRRVYHIRLSRRRGGPSTDLVRSPRHILVYRVDEEGDVVIVLRILHDAMDLVFHSSRQDPEASA